MTRFRVNVKLTNEQLAIDFSKYDITDKAFLSTSSDEYRNFFRNTSEIRMNVTAKKGTNAFFTDNYKAESEVIFGRDTPAVITGIRKVETGDDTLGNMVELVLDVEVG